MRQPSLCTLLTKVCWRGQPVPWHGWLQPNNTTGLAPGTTPFLGSPLPFTPHHEQCLLPDQLCTVCFWQQLWKDYIECKYNYSSHPKEDKELWLTEVARGLLTRWEVTSCSSLPPPLPLHHAAGEVGAAPDDAPGPGIPGRLKSQHPQIPQQEKTINQLFLDGLLMIKALSSPLAL